MKIRGLHFRYFLPVLIPFLCFAAEAQSKRNISLGFQCAPSFTGLAAAKVNEQAGGQAAVLLSYPLTGHLSLEGGLGFDMYRFTHTEQYAVDSEGHTIPRDRKFRFQYLEVPVMLSIASGSSRLHFISSIGLVPACKINGTQTLDEPEEAGTRFNIFLAAHAGLEYTFGTRLKAHVALAARYGAVSLYHGPVLAYLHFTLNDQKLIAWGPSFGLYYSLRSGTK